MKNEKALEADPLAAVRQLLTTWGAWMRDLSGAGVGYPKAAAFARAGEVRSTGETEADAGTAEGVDQVLAQLRVRRPALWDVVACEYWHQLSNIEAASRLGMSVAAYKNRRLQAENYVAGMIESQASLTAEGLTG